MRVTLVIAKYPWWAVPFAFLSMMLFRFPLWADRSISFWRLMGSGRNGGFDLVPEVKQWAILLVHPKNAHPLKNERVQLPDFIHAYLNLFRAKTITYILEPVEGHGLWNGRKVFGQLPRQSGYDGKIAVLTRATIRVSQLIKFWKNVPLVNRHMKNTKGLLSSYGIGEIPFIKQATFSIWNSSKEMKDFAYGLQEHKEVIRKTNQQNWYKEEMFTRFKIVDIIEIQPGNKEN